MAFVNAIDNLPKIAKILLALPFLDIVWAIYRIIKGATTQNWVTMVAGILWIVFGCFITWILDIVFLILDKQPLFTE
ncbi:MAG: hypothetical protein J6B60_04380 [Clostridia bacterium]|nr:hypothetical protein [Clostridia bacterium]